MGIMRAKASFVTYSGGAPRMVHVGDLLEDTDPVMKGREHLFEGVEDHVRRPSGRSGEVEAATAEPGEKRSVRPSSAVRGRKPSSGSGQ